MPFSVSPRKRRNQASAITLRGGIAAADPVDLVNAYLCAAGVPTSQHPNVAFQFSDPEFGDRILYSSKMVPAASSPLTEKPGMMSPASSFSFESRPASSRASKSGRSRSVSRPNSNRNSFVVT